MRLQQHFKLRSAEFIVKHPDGYRGVAGCPRRGGNGKAVGFEVRGVLPPHYFL